MAQSTKPRKIIVSMTSYPARILGVSKVLETIFTQTRTPDEIVLWLADSQFPNKMDDLPRELIEIVEKGKITLRWCNDLKPHKKYFYAFKSYPDDLLITVDDDILHRSDLIEILYQSYLQNPNAVSTYRAHLIVTTKQGKILPYNMWPKEIDNYLYLPSHLFCATGGAGTLYPVNLFASVSEMLDESIVENTCLYADDLWLKAMELMADIPVAVAGKIQPFIHLPDSQEIGLYHSNMYQGENDIQLRKIQEVIDRRYGEGTFIQKLQDARIGDTLTCEEALCELLEDRRLSNKKLQRAVGRDAVKIENANKRAEDANKRAENANKRAENANKRAEDANKRAEDANKRAENANKRADRFKSAIELIYKKRIDDLNLMQSHLKAKIVEKNDSIAEKNREIGNCKKEILGYKQKVSDKDKEIRNFKKEIKQYSNLLSEIKKFSIGRYLRTKILSKIGVGKEEYRNQKKYYRLIKNKS